MYNCLCFHNQTCSEIGCVSFLEVVSVLGLGVCKHGLQSYWAEGPPGGDSDRAALSPDL